MKGIEKNKKGNQCPVAQQHPPTPIPRLKIFILLMSQLMTRRSINYHGGWGGPD